MSNLLLHALFSFSFFFFLENKEYANMFCEIVNVQE